MQIGPRTKWFVVLLTALLCVQASAQIRVIAQVDTSNDIYVGQSFQYMIILDGYDQPAQVDLAPLSAYNPQSAGNRAQTSIQIVNGRTTRRTIKRYVMAWELTAGKPGTIQLPPVTVTIEGKQYKTNAVPVNILEPGKTDKIDLELVLSEKRCYVGQPVILTVNFYVDAQADVGDFQFDIPAFNSDAFYIEDTDVSDPQARQYQLNTGMRVSVSQSSVVRNGKRTALVQFSKVLIPKRAGTISLGRSSVSAAVAVGVTRSRDPFGDFGFFGSRKKYQRFMVTTEELTLDVEPLPDAGRPDGFYGLVGRYTISASASPKQVNVGDPITLTIRIGGSRFLKPVQWPDLEQIAAMAENFKIPTERASPVIENGQKVFTQTIRANNDQVTQIPAIPLPLFDPDRGEYTVAASKPIPLEVEPTRVLTAADIESVQHESLNKEVVAITKGLAANYEQLDVLTDQAFSPVAALVRPGYAAIWAVPLLGLIASGLARLVMHSSPEKQAARRRRQACRQATRELERAESAEAQQRNELMAAALRQYVGDRFDKMAGSLTADDCTEAVAQATGEGELARRYGRIVSDCEASRYAATTARPVQPGEAIELVLQVERKAGRRR